MGFMNDIGFQEQTDPTQNIWTVQDSNLRMLHSCGDSSSIHRLGTKLWPNSARLRCIVLLILTERFVVSILPPR